MPADRRYTLLDISMGGLSFIYPSEDELPRDTPNIAKRLFLPDELALDTIHCLTVSDQPVAADPDSPSAMRRRGVKFDSLTTMQRLMLRYFIWLQPQSASSPSQTPPQS